MLSAFEISCFMRKKRDSSKAVSIMGRQTCGNCIRACLPSHFTCSLFFPERNTAEWNPQFFIPHLSSALFSFPPCSTQIITACSGPHSIRFRPGLFSSALDLNSLFQWVTERSVSDIDLQARKILPCLIHNLSAQVSMAQIWSWLTEKHLQGFPQHSWNLHF